MKIEHLGIAVKDMEKAIQIYSDVLNTAPYKSEEVQSEGVQTVFFQTGESKVELLSATREDSAIAKFIAQRGEGIHHVAFHVENIVEEIERLKALGYIILNETPKLGADNKLICFLHPKSTGGVLIELCQDKG